MAKISAESEIFETLNLNDLADVDTTGVTANDFLQFDGTNWLDFDLFATANTWTADQTYATATKLLFRDTGTFISSPSASELRITSETGLSPVITFLAGSVESMRFSTSGIIFNEDSSSLIDIRIETDNITHMFFSDASADSITFGSLTALAFVGIDGQADEIQFFSSSKLYTNNRYICC